MRNLIAVCCALLIAFGFGWAWYAQSPSWSDILSAAREHPVSSRPSALEWENPALLAEMAKERLAAGEDTLFLLGSSELTMPAIDSMHPNVFFDSYDNGFGIMGIGLHGCHCLWQTIETAALDDQGAFSPKRKVALLVGMQWFFEEGCTQAAFLNRFSDEAFRECMENPRLSEETKGKIRLRAEALGADSQLLDELSSDSAVAIVNSWFRNFFDNPKEREELMATVKEQKTLQDLAGERQALLPWDAYDAIALEDAAEACTNNDLGMYDDYYAEYWPEIEANMAADTLPSFRDWNKDELTDLSLFLDVCDELNIEPYMIIMPSMGSYYDQTHYDEAARSVLYGELRSMFERAGVPYLDMTNHDYDKYYLRDVMHLAWRGWVEVDHALYDFYWSDSEETKSGYAAFAEEAIGSGDNSKVRNEASIDKETEAEQEANEAEIQMLEAEGAGTEVFDGADAL